MIDFCFGITNLSPIVFVNTISSDEIKNPSNSFSIFLTFIDTFVNMISKSSISFFILEYLLYFQLIPNLLF